MPGLFNDYNPIERIASNQHGISTNTIGRGSLIAFHYPQSYAIIPNIIHDPYPLIIVTDIWTKYIRGLNLHYLTFPYVKKILTTFGGKNFSYFNIKPDKYMANAFRMYVRQGVRQPKKLDVEWITGVLASVKSFDVGEIEKIRTNIQQQIHQRLQIKANQIEGYENWRKQLSESQKRQLRGKTSDAQSIITRGSTQNLIYPNNETTGSNEAI